VNTSTVDKLISDFSSCLTTLQPQIGTPSYWDGARDCGDINDTIQIELQDNLRPVRECYGNKASIEERKKEKKRNNLDTQIKDVLRNNKDADVSSLQALTARMDELFVKAAGVTGCTAADNEILKDIWSELDRLFQDFYNSYNDVSNVANEARQVKENKKEFETQFKKKCSKELKREFSNYEKGITKLKKKRALTDDEQAGYDNVTTLYAELCTTIIANMEKAVSENDPVSFEDLRQDFWARENDFRDATNELVQGLNEQQQREESSENVTRDIQEKKRELTRIQKELKRTNKLFNKAAKKYLDKAERKEALAVFASHLAQAADLIARMGAGLEAAKEEAANDPDAYWEDRSEELQDLQNEFIELQSTIQNITNALQAMKEAERGVKSAEKDLKNIRRESGNDPELMKNLEGLLAQAKEFLQQVWASLVTDPEDAMEKIEDIQQLENDWNEAIQNWRESQDIEEPE
jgi:hypothetical protein